MSRAAGTRARLFFALWPNERVRSALAEIAREAHAACGGRAIAAANLHLTLFFLGNIERDLIPELEAAAVASRGAEFELTLDRFGYWRHTRIAWVGTTQAPSALTTLYSALAAALESAGIGGEERPFSPHITLVRNAERRPPAAPAASCVWDVREFALVESIPVARGVSYEPRAHWPLHSAP